MDRMEAALMADPDGTDKLDQRSVPETLEDLIETCRDGEFGFHHAADKIGDPALAAQFRLFGNRRGEMARELEDAAARFGVERDESTTVAGGLHRGWISLKAALTSGDGSIVAAAATGEQHAVDRYAAALEPDLPADVAAVVRRHYTEIENVRAEVDEIATRLG